ncbi:hypothetical protein SGUI_1776 [Serinicoccus hydrothermalis]|uniref:Uncharacterized protein n=1 Tax=Serinicoccus hydrothermalis TaxID=1758689 RepID=A0A1B1NCL3_9MICO|nr:hypothetical protein [Serinicoccus hydrothermalis]ANS79172.1 hypothetical protein SGUI_1776 [Serinicoccus hydrothermalis]
MALTALGGCSLLGEDDTRVTTSGGSVVTARADQAAAREQQPRVREILQDLWDQFDLEDKPPLEDKPGEGDLRSCTLGGTDRITAWAEGTQLRVSQEPNPELEAEQAELVRAWLDDNGWERIDNPAPEGDPVTYHRNDGGFTVTVAPQLDARVNLDEESPCFDDQGRQVG